MKEDCAVPSDAIRMYKIDRIKPEKAVEVLAKSGLKVSVEQAKNILDLLYILAKLEVEQYLKI